MIKRNFLMISALILSLSAQASIQGVPTATSNAPSLTLHQRNLDRSCFSIRATSFDLDCNPAFLADSEKRLIRLNSIGDDNALSLDEYRESLDRDDVIGAADKFLNNKEPVQAHASAAAWYQNNWWAVGVVPVRASVSYLNRNPAYPEISAYAFQESEVFAKVGLLSTESQNIKFGIQTRYVQRDFIYQKFYALDAVLDPEVIEVKSNKALYIEPGFAFSWDSEYEPVFSWMITDLPVFQEGDKIQRQPKSDFGFSSSFGSLIPGLRTTTHYHRRAGTDISRHLSWSALYEVKDFAAVSVHSGRDIFGIAIDGRISVFVAGISYRNEKFEIDSWTSSRVRSTTAEIGLTF
jgi:hypothetical protein